ncbi:RusA-like resolvase [Arthrobacter phage Andrew]|uniref:RusA-like resolvase n=1 Tax=Arthrobacter phage Andrew TaxID=2419946 RepID=A0A3G2KD73_9CAUD|nr:RusA-like Holliday junction resolvase [Arthrobacter phage Andrew]AYN56860.1 RusA-like resolvase [Arthrobacter phage Andrew]
MSARQVNFWAAGVPIPQGSKRIGRSKATGRPILLDDNDRSLKPWRELVAWTGKKAIKGGAPLDGPLVVGLTFYLPRPGGHYKKDGSLRAAAPKWPAVKPDVDKLERAVFDALTAGKVWADDARAVEVHKTKLYAGLPHEAGVYVVISEMEEWAR